MFHVSYGDPVFSKTVTHVTQEVDCWVSETKAQGENRMLEGLLCDICHVWLGIRRNKPREEFPNLKAEMKGSEDV